MKVGFYTNIVSPHQLPLARAIVQRVGDCNYRYVFTEMIDSERSKMGWCVGTIPSWCVRESAERDFLENADVVYCSHRDFDLFTRRHLAGRKSFYVSERWFKPWTGMLRLLKPSYLKMAWHWVALLRKSDCALYLPLGIHAARDMARLCGLFAGDLRCLFRAPLLDYERKPGGRIWLKDGCDGDIYCLGKMRMWGYFVEEGRGRMREENDKAELRVLWVGRLINWKRVDTIVRAVGECARMKHMDDSLPSISLDVYGTGPEERRLKMFAAKYDDAIRFYPPVPIADVRKLMREHDVYVLSSNSYEGWGAVVSEALEEGTKVIGTYEAGSSSTILPDSNLFYAGDWRGLMKLLLGGVPTVGIGEWTARHAADYLVE